MFTYLELNDLFCIYIQPLDLRNRQSFPGKYFKREAKVILKVNHQFLRLKMMRILHQRSCYAKVRENVKNIQTIHAQFVTSIAKSGLHLKITQKLFMV